MWMLVSDSKSTDHRAVGDCIKIYMDTEVSILVVEMFAGTKFCDFYQIAKIRKI